MRVKLTRKQEIEDQFKRNELSHADAIERLENLGISPEEAQVLVISWEEGE